MARIPIIQERQAVGQLMAVPELRVPDTGAVLIGASMRQVGQALNQTAQSANQVMDRQAQLWATETSTNELTYWTQRSEELKSQVGKGGAGYFQQLNQEYEQRANSILAQAPNDKSRQYLAQNFLNVRQRLLTNAIEFEVVEGRAAFKNELNSSANKVALVAAQTKDPVLIQQSIGQLEAQIDASNLLPREKEEAKRNLKTTVSTAYASAVVRDNPAAAVDILSQGVPTVTSEIDKESLYNAVGFVESANNPKAVGPMTRYGQAIGLMQVLPSTAMKPGVKLANGSQMPNIFDFAESKGVEFGARNEGTAKELLKNEKIGKAFGRMYLDAMLVRYDNNVVYALAAYNWGPGNADNWDGDMSKLPEQTRDYIPKVLNRAGLTGTNAGAPKDSLFSMLPLGDQLRLLDTAKSNQSAQIVQNTASTVFRQFGPQSDTDAVELDIMNDHIDVLMAGNTLQERKEAKTLLKEYANSHTASANQRLAERDSKIWSQVLEGQSMQAIQDSPEWKALDGRSQAKLIGEISSFRTEPTTPYQWAKYYEYVSNPQRLAAMSQDEILFESSSFGKELTIQLLKEKAKLSSPADIGKAEIDEELFKRMATEAGLKPYTAKTEDEKRQVGELRYAFEREIQAQQNIIKRPLTRDEIENAMYNVINNKVFVDRTLGDEELPVALVERDDYDETYVRVGDQTVYLKNIPAESRAAIVRQLRAAGEPVTEAAIAEIYIGSQANPLFEQIPR